MLLTNPVRVQWFGARQFWSASQFSNQYNRFTVTATARGRIRNLPAFRRALLTWYKRNRRNLPWRRTSDPYRIWLSEIMLQQTRVAVVIERYEQFLERFPTIEELAAAREASVLAEWSGLGYYRRARNLRTAAKVIVRAYAGDFPTSAELKSLPGIGRYTAAAIASIAFGEPVGLVDGNVERAKWGSWGTEERRARSCGRPRTICFVATIQVISTRR